MLSSSQEQIWFATEACPDATAYSMFLKFKLKGHIDAEAMRNALSVLYDRHEQLRVSMRMIQGRVIQCVMHAVEPLIRIIDTRILQYANLDVETILADETKIKFSLHDGILFRACIIILHDHEALLILEMHHICADSWSLGVLLRDFIKLYAENIHQRQASLPPLAASYFDYVNWQQQYRASQQAKMDRAWWQQTLQDVPHCIALPRSSKTMMVTQDSQVGERIVFEMAQSSLSALKQIAVKQQCTLYCVLLSILNALLYRYTDQDDFVIGVPLANRPKQVFYDLVGYFVNMVVIRTPLLQSSLRFSDYLEAVKINMLDAFSHGSMPFDEIVKLVQPERNQAQVTPLANVVLVLQNAPLPALNDELFSIELLSQHNGSAKFDLLFNFYEDKEGLIGILEYPAHQFNHAMMQELVQAFITITHAIIADITQCLEQLPLLHEEQEKQSIKNHISLMSAFALIETPVQRFQRIVHQNKDRIALTHHEKCLTYDALERRSNQLAHYLSQAGIQKGNLVALTMPVSFELITAMIAILKIGAAYLPIDNHTPEDRFLYFLNHSNISTLIVDDQLHLNDYCKKVSVLIDLSKIQSILTQMPIHFTAQTTLDDLAYVIYTSGSTGQPKGVMVSNYNLMSLFVSAETCFNFSADDVWTLFHSFAFDFSVWEIWGALLFGGRLVLIDAEQRSCTDAFYEVLKSQRVTVLNQTPSAFYELINIDRIHASLALSQLRYVIFGGAALSLSRLIPWLQKYGDASPELINMYGITEITVHASFKRLHKNDILNATQSLIGHALPHLALFVLDNHMRCLPLGAIGEIYIAGPGVAKGYLNAEALTQERFKEIPHIMQGNLYKTGDLARYLSANELEYISRMDRQVKIRGFRIELSEIEQSILSHPSIKQVLVLNIESQEQQALVAYLLVKPECFSMIQQQSIEQYSSSFITSQVSDWQNTFDYNYMRDDALIDDPLFNISGWHSAIDKLPMSKEVMSEWLTNIVERLRQLPFKSVLEIGCGSGMILARLAPQAEQYIATDFSKEALNYVATRVLPVIDAKQKVRLVHAPAHDLSCLIDDSPDLVILNSIVQYFPSLSYFLTVLTQIIQRMPSGYIVIGDVRSFELAPCLYAEAAEAQLPIGIEKKMVNDWIELNIIQENELILSHLFFFALQTQFSSITHIEVRPHQGQLCDELNLYRYDVILAINKQPTLKPSEFHVVNGMRFSLKTLKMFLNSTQQRTLYIKNLIHQTLLAKIKSLPHKAVEVIFPADEMQLEGIALNEIERICQQLGLSYELCMNHESPIYFDLIITPSPMSLYPQLREISPNQDTYQWVSSPIKNQIKHEIRTDIESILCKKLPEYMHPTEFIFIENIPLTQQGKINEKALPAPAILFSLKTRLKTYVAAKTETEQKMIKAFESILKIRGIGRFDHFFDLGGHSLLVVRLMLFFQEKFGIQISINAIMKHPTVMALADYIDNQSQHIQEELIDKNDFNLLPIHFSELNIKPLSSKSRHLPTALFLTGATGYLGIHLLHSLLTETSADIYCLIRAENESNGFKKLTKALRYYELDGSEMERKLARVHVICGDLSLPNLALNLTQLDFLYQRIDLILHNGASVNFMMPYASLKPSNIDSTKILLKWAMECRVPFHFVSSLYVFTQADVQNGEVLESQLPTTYQSLSLGYLKTKWVCEQLFVQARQCGCFITNYRVGRISGATHSGINQSYDFFWNFIRACFAIRKIPDIEFNINLIPVNYVATFIAKVVSINHSSLDKNYHLLNKNTISLSVVKQILMQHHPHLRMQICSFEEWSNTLKNAEANKVLDDTIVSLLPLLTQLSKDSDILFNAENSLQVANDLALDTQDMQQQLMAFYLDKEIQLFNEYIN